VSARQAQQAVITAFGTIRQSMALEGLPVRKAPFVFRDEQVDALFESSDGDRKVFVEVMKDVYNGLKGCTVLCDGNPMDRIAKMEARLKREFERIGLYGVTVAIIEVMALTPRVDASTFDVRARRYQGKQPGLTPRGGPVRPTTPHWLQSIGAR
jgi:hypothetical protein